MKLFWRKSSSRERINILVVVVVVVACITWGRGVRANGNQQTCFEICICETFLQPTVSTSAAGWPSLRSTSILSQAFANSYKNATSFEALVTSMQEENDLENSKLSHSSKTIKGLRNPKEFLRSAIAKVSSAMLPGEVSINCSNKEISKISQILQQNDSNNNLQASVKLDLSFNAIMAISVGDFDIVPSMRYLNLARNQLTSLADEDFAPLSRLVLLSFHGNKIYHIGRRTFSNLTELETLDLTDNQLSEVPSTIRNCRSLRQLLLGGNRITYVNSSDFQGLLNLEWVNLQGNPLLDVHVSAFVGLPSLVKLILESVRDLDIIPSFNGSSSLESIRIDRAALTSVRSDSCVSLPQLRSLNFHLNKLKNIISLRGCSKLRLLDLSNNRISSLGSRKFEQASELHDLLLQFNFIEFVPNDAFVGLENLQVLNLEYNKITVIESDAFLPLVRLEDINLGNNAFPEIPSMGLEHVVILKAHNNRHLRVFPGPESFPAVHSLVLSYAYHCCPFLSLSDGQETASEIREDVVFSFDQLHKFDPEIWNRSDVWPHIEGIPTTAFLNVWVKKINETTFEEDFNSTKDTLIGAKSAVMHNSKHKNATRFIHYNKTGNVRNFPLHNVQCIPQPGPFMPCRDLFDWWTLRCGVWLVFLLALMGNGVVVIVLVSAYSKMDVPRFLVSNLALADFFMGIYLGFLAVVDASTLGDFRMYAIPWQMSAGCQMAGFLGVLSSELSVYTLTVITMERNYAITHAMHLNKRLSLKHAAYIMVIGWIFAVTMAILPLTGVSDYRKFAVCLPFETSGHGLGYIVFLMFINGIAFLILMGCYLKIYCAIKGSQAWNSNDSRIAKRMALLVFTDFICWAPIAFFSLSAAFGLQLLSLEGAKVFTVFVLPLNSCCNPFLYALLTKQFKKDCVMLCKAIEESRVTRGIGRCRHSSNFSNRQTPANTNSALDQLSKEENNGCSCKVKDQHRSHVAFRALKLLCCGNNEASSSRGERVKTQLGKSPSKPSIPSTFNKSSSSWSWRGQSVSNLRLLELRRQTTLDLARKSSQESSLSSSRNDSSGTSGSTVTWRISRSSVSSDASSGGIKGPRTGSINEKNKDDSDSLSKSDEYPSTKTGLKKARLQRQRAVDKEPGSINYSLGNELRCPLHSRGDNLSCVYEQASLEEEDSNDVFVTSHQPPCYKHHRSLSDGILCGTLLSMSAPTPELIPPISLNLPSTSNEVSQPKTDLFLEKKGLLETHFPVANAEGDPLLRKHST